MDKGKCCCGKTCRSEAPANRVAAHIYRAKGFSERGVRKLFCLGKQPVPSGLCRNRGVFPVPSLTLLSLQLKIKVDATVICHRPLLQTGKHISGLLYFFVFLFSLPYVFQRKIRSSYLISIIVTLFFPLNRIKATSQDPVILLFLGCIFPFFQ